MKILRGIIIFICLGIIAFGCWKIFSIQFGYHQGEQAYEELETFIAIPEPPTATRPAGTKPTATNAAAATAPDGVPEETLEYVPIDFPEVDFNALRGVNPGVVGWIYCEGTSINYPIVQGPDNDYYLDHLFNGQPNGSGAIFLDRRNKADFSDVNSIVFGHNMKNGAMFAGLTGYKTQSFYEEHPRFLLMTPEKNYVAEIFAGVVMGEWDKVWQIDFADDSEIEGWLENLIAQSRITTDVTPTAEDRILTLSTCSYEYNGARFVVLCVLRAA